MIVIENQVIVTMSSYPPLPSGVLFGALVAVVKPMPSVPV